MSDRDYRPGDEITFARRPAPEALPIWTVYQNPSDFLGQFVARKHLVPGGVTDEHLTADNLEELRAKLPGGLYRFDRNAADDPVIVEVWL